MHQLLNDLPERWREILILRYGLNGDEPKSLEYVARKFHLSRERIRQIEREAMTHLRANPKVRQLHADHTHD